MDNRMVAFRHHLPFPRRPRAESRLPPPSIASPRIGSQRPPVIAGEGRTNRRLHEGYDLRIVVCDRVDLVEPEAGRVRAVLIRLVARKEPPPAVSGSIRLLTVHPSDPLAVHHDAIGRVRVAPKV